MSKNFNFKSRSLQKNIEVAKSHIMSGEMEVFKIAKKDVVEQVLG